MIPVPETTEPRSPGKSFTIEAGARRRAPASPYDGPAGTCPHFGPCGGCSLLDRAYADQLRSKRATVERALREAMERDTVGVDPVLADPRPFHYRNKAIYPLRERRRGGARVVEAGFFRRRSHAIVDVRRCDIQEPALTEVANRLREEIARSGAEIYDEETGRGSLRHLFLRVGVGTGDLMVAFVTAKGPFLEGGRLAEAASRAAEGLRTTAGKRVRAVSILRNVQPGAGNVILGPRTDRLLGGSHLLDRFGPLTLRVSLRSFLQVHPRMAAVTYGLVRDLAGEAARGRVADAYSGIGTLALLLAREASEVVGIEETEEAVEDAAWNASCNRLANARFLAGRVEEVLPGLRGPLDLLVLDPPRSGCAPPVLEAGRRLGPRAIVYVSCNPTSLARDLSLLRGDYRLAAVRPVDLFPQTDHVEVVALLLQRKG
jgi:23S rRNA (uracil1939-C5)-methyltransferase